MDELQVKRSRRGPATSERRTEPDPALAQQTGTHDPEQARRHAQAAQQKVAQRRAQQSGAAAWVSERASQWSLDGPDWDFLELQKYVWNPVMDYWFRMEIDGWEQIPEPPALLVGIHSGAPFVWDAWTVGFQWWRHFGRTRTLHGTAHDALMALPVLGSYFRRMGVLPAAPDSIAGALAAGHDVILWPGGERDSLRHWTQRDEAVLAGRSGFVRLAIRSGVPIVPIATVGGADAMPVLATGQRLAKLMRLDKLARLKMFPIALQAPWGISPALLPEIPLPAKIRTRFQEPVRVDTDPSRAQDDAYVQEVYEEVRGRIQAGMDALARRRRLPVFG